MKLSVGLPGFTIVNPLIAASGVLGTSAGLMVRAHRAGAGAVVTKSVGLEAREGFPGPNVAVLPHGLLNSMGLPNPGAAGMAGEVEEACRAGVKLIASVYGFTEEDYVDASSLLSTMGVEAVELNLSCPTVEGTGQEIGQDPGRVEGIVRKVRGKMEKPVFVKLTPNITDIVEAGRAAERAGADAVVAINTVGGMAIDVQARRPLLSVGAGGLSGPMIKPIAVRMVYRLYESLKIPIIGCGGIMDYKDVVEFLLAGATAVQMGTALMYKGFGVFREVEAGLKSYMEENGFEEVSQLRGIAHEG